MIDDIIKFDELKKVAFDFEHLLKKHGISIASGSDIERIYLNIIDLLDYDTLAINSDTRPIYQELMGLHDFAFKMLQVQDHPDFLQLLPHIELLNSSSILQNTSSVVTDQGSNKLFELYFATILMQIGSNLELEPPQIKKSRNPDIIIKIDNLKWGIACKALHSNKHLTFLNRLSEGISQIQNSSADIGFVAFNFKNIIPHDEIWPIINKDEIINGAEPIFAAYTDIQFPSHELQKIGNSFHDKLKLPTISKEIVELFSGKKSLPLAIGYLSTAVGIVKNEKPVPTRLSAFHIINFKKFNEDNTSVFERMNHIMHNRQNT